MNTKHQPAANFSLSVIGLKTILVHTVTYFLVGLISYTVFDYSARYADPLLGGYMRQTNHSLVAAGTLFQILRGFLFGLVFYWLRDIFFGRKNGWVIMWLTLLIVGVISPFGPSPSSIEGMLYSTIPFYFHLIGLPEVTVQSLLLAFFTHYWVNHPRKKWLTWIFGILFGLSILMSIMGILAATAVLPRPA